MINPDTLQAQVIALMLGNAALSVVMAMLIRRDFRCRGRASLVMAIWSGMAMHGHAALSVTIAWLDRGSLYPLMASTLLVGCAVAGCGAWVIILGRRAYGSVARVYGLREDQLIARGVYRYTRNPQYLGYLALVLGLTIAAGSAWALGFSMLFALIIHGYICGVEEPHLQRIFGTAYAHYCQRVARYWGRVGRQPVPIADRPQARL